MDFIRGQAERHQRNPLVWPLIVALVILDVALASSVLVQGIYYGILIVGILHHN
jgi:hypothetical protein